MRALFLEISLLADTQGPSRTSPQPLPYRAQACNGLHSTVLSLDFSVSLSLYPSPLAQIKLATLFKQRKGHILFAHNAPTFHARIHGSTGRGRNCPKLEQSLLGAVEIEARGGARKWCCAPTGVIHRTRSLLRQAALQAVAVRAIVQPSCHQRQVRVQRFCFSVSDMLTTGHRLTVTNYSESDVSPRAVAEVTSLSGAAAEVTSLRGVGLQWLVGWCFF